MAEYYLLKTEPSEYSFADLQKDKQTVWDGVTNPAAVKNLRELKSGAKLVIYETGNIRSAVGTATVVSVDAADPKNPRVKIAAGKPLARAVPLGEIKADKLFADSPLLTMGRLSVVPLTAQQYEALTRGSKMQDQRLAVQGGTEEQTPAGSRRYKITGRGRRRG
jgi:predicted RNA-binding protein with PUA-like domain